MINQRILKLAISSCPNDTFAFHAWIKGLLPDAPSLEVELTDIDQLNQIALAQEADVVKISSHAFAYLRENYALLHSGGAMGRGVGPLLVAAQNSAIPSIATPATTCCQTEDLDSLAQALSQVSIAIPGELTTAALLVGLLVGQARKTIVMPFDRIMPAIVAGEVAAGSIIHEGRFTFESYGLRKLLDLGAWWETTSSLPLPLGGIAVRRSLSHEVKAKVELAVHASVVHARQNPQAAHKYATTYAQEMAAEVCQAHIDLYVNEYTEDYGSEGAQAIQHLLARATEIGVVPASSQSIFWDEDIERLA